MRQMAKWQSFGAVALVLGLTGGMVFAKAQGLQTQTSAKPSIAGKEFVLKFSPERLTQLFQTLQASDGSFRVVNGLLTEIQAQIRAQISNQTASEGDKK